MTFHIAPVPTDIVDAARATGHDAAGTPVEHWTANGGEPIRCCLRDAKAGEELILLGFRPPLAASPYAETGAIFAHAAPCGGPLSDDRYPEDWYGRPQVLRAYDARGWIHPSTTTHDGTDPEAAIAQILTHDDVVQIHSRNIAYGCYMFTVTR